MRTSCFSLAFGGRYFLSRLLTATWILFSAVAFAQAPAAGGDVAPTPTAAELDQLVGPVALYPDDLIGIILPASTYPLEIVQADRYLEKKKTDKNLPVNEAWQDSVKSLLNYPDVVKKMSTELDWTSDLGEAVVTDQGAVLEAIQRFRRQVQAAGNLKSDDKQTIIVEKEVIQVVQANPEVIYVPQYNPTTVVVAGGYPSYAYYPTPYPVYYYPYPPGAAFATGLIWGAAITAAWHGGHYATHYGYGGGEANININRNTTINNANINANRSTRQASAQGTAWKSEKRPGQVSGQTGRTNASNRVGDVHGSRGSRDLGGSGARPSNPPATRPSAGTSDRSAGSAQMGDRGDRGGQADRNSAQNRSSGAFDSYGSGRDTRADSSRGASSRQSMSSSGRGQSFQGGGGGGGRSAASGSRSGGGGARMPAGGGGRGGRR